MKKFAVLIIIAFVTVIALSSCNKKACPAYSKADTEKPVHV